MGKISKSEQGFSVVEALLIVLILVVIGFVGWYVKHASDTSYDTYNKATASDSAAPSVTKKSTTPNSTKSTSTTPATTTKTSPAQ